MLVLYYDFDDGNSIREQKFWNTITKAVEIVFLPSQGTTLGNYLIGFVDAVQALPTDVVIYKGSFQYFNALEQIHLVDSILLETYNISEGFKKIVTFNTLLKVLEITTIDLTGNSLTSSHSNSFLISDTYILSSTCQGTSKKEIYYENKALNNIIYENSVECGFIPPTSGTILTEQKIIRIDHSCHEFPVMLSWKNLIGGWDRFIFDFDQTITVKVENSQEIKNYSSDISKPNSVFNLKQENRKTIIVGSDTLTFNEYDALVPHLVLSPSVNIVFPIASGLKDIPVTIIPNEYSRSEKEGRSKIEIEIQLPDFITVNN